MNFSCYCLAFLSTEELTIQMLCHSQCSQGLTLTTRPVLFGIYNDPRRDTRRHSTSVVYIADLPPDVSPRAGDDAVDVVRLPVAEIENNDFFIDHKTVLHDYVQMRQAQMADASGQPREVVEDMEPFKRSFCRY